MGVRVLHACLPEHGPTEPQRGTREGKQSSYLTCTTKGAEDGRKFATSLKATLCVSCTQLRTPLGPHLMDPIPAIFEKLEGLDVGFWGFF